MHDGDTNRVLQFVKNQQQVLHHYHHATSHDYGLQCTSLVPGSLILDLLKRYPSEILAFFHQQYPIQLRAYEQIHPKNEQLQRPKIQLAQLTSPVEYKHRQWRHKLAKDVI